MNTPVVERGPFKCKRGVHTWSDKADADKCCNGYTRVLVFNGGVNQQICEGVAIGRRWKPVGESC